MNDHLPLAEPDSFRSKAKRILLTGITSVAVLAAGLVVIPSAAPAVAAPGDIAFGVVSVDSNKNNALDAGATPAELPVAGVAVTLTCATPLDASQPGWATTTVADGAWSFATADVDLATQCAPDSELIVSINSAGAAGNVLAVHPATSGDNAFAAAPDENQLAVSAPFAPGGDPVELNGLIWPTWSFSLALVADPTGFEGNSVYTGTGPWDANTTEPGTDDSPGNNLVRSGDLVNYNWSLAASTEQALASTTASAIFEQTITLTDGAVANFSRIPAVCSGTVPATSIIAQPSGTSIAAGVAPPAGTTSVVLSCNLGLVGEDASAQIVPTTVRTFLSAPNGSSFETSTRAYAVDEAGVSTAQPSESLENGPIEITSAPAFDVVKGAPFYSTITNININGVSTPGQAIGYPIYITVERKTGVEALAQPITITDMMSATNAWPGSPNEGSPISDLEFHIYGCSPGSDWSMPIMGKKNGDEARDLYSTSDSGSCAINRTGDATSAYELTLSGIDMSGQHYPTQTRSGTSLEAGPYYVAAYQVWGFIPLTEFDKTNGVIGDEAGSMAISNQLSGFDSEGITGSSNYGSGKEPGFCASTTPGDCDEMENGGKSNNISGPITRLLSPGGFSKGFYDFRTPYDFNAVAINSATAGHDGTVLVQPGETHIARLNIGAGSQTLESSGVCDVFDNSVLKLAPLNQAINLSALPADQYFTAMEAYRGGTYNAAFRSHFTIQYAVVDKTGDTANNGTLNVGQDRYEGVWSAQNAAGCGDADQTWYNSIDEVPGGIDAINAVRIVDTDPNYALEPGNTLVFGIAMQQRDTYFGGPNHGASIPEKTVSVNFGRPMRNGTWSTGNHGYRPIPENGATDGDRWTLVRGAISLAKRTVSVDGKGGAVANFGTTGHTLAGTPVIWEVLVSAQSSAAGQPIRNVVITDTLPKHVTYNADETAALSTGTPADTAVVNADGTTTLTWNIAEIPAGGQIPSRIIYTETDPLSPPGVSLVNAATVAADNIPTVRAHSDTHTVVLEQSGQIQLRKDVDAVLDLQNDTQKYTLSLKNFSETLAFQPVTVIDVLPYNGDNTAPSAPRSPGSKYSGTNELTGPITAFDFGGTKPAAGKFFYTSDAPGTVDQNLDANTTTWYSEDQFGDAGAPADFSEVTAFKFVGETELKQTSLGDDSGLKLKFETAQNNNKAGDRYYNRFTTFTSSLMNNGKYQMLNSNQTAVRVVGFSLGDLVWIDNNNDGIFTEGVDTPAPAGVEVQVFKSGETAPLVTTTTNAEGRWVTNDLEEGDYFVVIPASEFAAGGKLNKYEAQPLGFVDDANTDANEGVDHHAQAGDAGAVKSSVITLSATKNGAAITGDEPTGDNVKNLTLSPLTTDDFTNLTLDLALRAMPGFEFTKTADPVSTTAVQPGDTITYTLTGTNTGLLALDPVTIGDDLTEVLAHAAITTEPVATIEGVTDVPAATRDGNDLAWTGSLEPGQSVAITYTVTVNEDAKGVIIRNLASASATPPPGYPEIVPPTVETWHPTPGYTFNKTANPATGTVVPVGGEVSYTLTGTNAGKTVLNPVKVTDDLAEVLAFADLVGDPVATITSGDTVAPATAPTLDGTTLNWTGTLQEGESVVITYTVKVKESSAGKILHNIASSTATPPTGPPIEPPAVETEHPIPGFSLNKTSNPESGSQVNPGDTITYTVIGDNFGATVLDPVVITDDLSKVLNNSALVGDVTAVITDAKGAEVSTATVPVAGSAFEWVGSLQAGEKVTLTYSVKVNANASDVTLRNVATGSATPPGLPPIVPPAGETFHDVPLAPSASPILALTGNPMVWAGLLVLALLAAGGALLIMRRRREAGEH